MITGEWIFGHVKIESESTPVQNLEGLSLGLSQGFQGSSKTRLKKFIKALFIPLKFNRMAHYTKSKV